MTLTELFAYGMEFIQAVLIPLVIYIGKYFSNFITEFRTQLSNIVETLGEIIGCLVNLKDDMEGFKSSMDIFARENQSTVQDMNAMSNLQVSTDTKVDRIGQQLAEIKGQLSSK